MATFAVPEHFGKALNSTIFSDFMTCSTGDLDVHPIFIETRFFSTETLKGSPGKSSQSSQSSSSSARQLTSTDALFQLQDLPGVDFWEFVPFSPLTGGFLMIFDDF